MTERRPFVLIDGELQQLPAGDTLPGSGDAAETGDMLVTARDPGAGWLQQDTVYSQSAYPDLFALVGLIGDAPPGQNWVTQTPSPGITTGVISACWVTGKTAVAVGLNVVWRTTDGGASWASIAVTGNLQTVARVSDSVVIAVGTVGVILRSTDAGATWSPVSSGVSADLRVIVVFSAARIYVGGGSSASRISTNGGATFSATSASLSDPRSAIRFNSTVAVVFASSGTTAARTTDGGATWANITVPSFANVRGSGVTFGESGLISNNTGALLRTNDQGLTWTAGTIAGAGGSQVGLVGTGGLSAVYVAGTSGASYYTVDGGQNFSPIGLALTGSQAVFANPDMLTVAVGNGVQFASLPEYGYDSATQFKTPKISGIGPALGGYVKS